MREAATRDVVGALERPECSRAAADSSPHDYQIQVYTASDALGGVMSIAPVVLGRRTDMVLNVPLDNAERASTRSTI